MGVQQGDVLYLILNNGAGATTGQFATLNGALFNASDVVVNGTHFQLSTTADFGGGGFASASGNDVALLAVPEPNSLAMMLGGLGMLCGWQRRRRVA